MDNKVIAVDIDGTLCEIKGLEDVFNKTYNEVGEILLNAEPKIKVISKINELSNNNRIILFTSRSDIHRDITLKWLKINKVIYNEIIFNKIYYDYILDDKSLSLSEFENE